LAAQDHNLGQRIERVGGSERRRELLEPRERVDDGAVDDARRLLLRGHGGYCCVVGRGINFRRPVSVAPRLATAAAGETAYSSPAGS